MYTDDVWGRSGRMRSSTSPRAAKPGASLMVDEIKRALEIAEIVPFRYLVQHMGVAGEECDERKIEAAFSSLDEISVFAGQRGVEVLLENIPNGLASAEGLNDFLALDAFESELLLRRWTCAYGRAESNANSSS